ncbi:MAG: aminotransferase class V-fold PLP-dependent enzyme [Bacteroidetes bacterium]|nr:aminotransferase class V-fold PLP-dependent enzyme [Bacteroidota bacterium]
MHLSEVLTHLGENRTEYFNAIAPPVIQSSNFMFADLKELRSAFSDELQHHVYTRGNNPTVAILREKLAALEGTEDALVFSSGAGAIAAAVIGNVQAGDHVICQQAPYSWTSALLRKLLARFGVSHSFVDGTDVENIKAAIQPNTKVLYLESPNTFTFDCQDLESCAALARAHGLVSIIDNSYASPIFQNPASFGIDVVLHSGTKYLNGHSDVVVGVLCANKAMVRKIFESELMTLGGILGPHDAALVLRGLRTLELRVKRSDENARFLIQQLENHPKVARIWHPFHPSFSQQSLARKQMRGCGGLFSVAFHADSFEQMEAFIHRIQRFLMAVSWGGHESLMMPSIGFYNIPGRENPPAHWNFVRFYAGLEDPAWLWEDLEQALVGL